MSGRAPLNPYTFIFYLTATLAAGLLLWDKAATPGMKAAASAWGESFIAAGRKAEDLQSTPWLENLGIVPKGTRKQQETKK